MTDADAPAIGSLLADMKQGGIADVLDDGTALDQGDAQARLASLASRFSAYLKDNFADAKTALAEKTGKATQLDARSSSLEGSDALNASVVQGVAQAASESGQNKSESDLSNSTLSNSDAQASDTALSGQSGAKKEISPSVQDKTKGGEDAAFKAEDDHADAPRVADTRADRGVNFEQFMSGIARREPNAAPAPMELSRGTPLSQNETLREGLDNVVRFARVSGEQKASMIIDPPALGRIVVELSATATGLEASIKVSSEQVRQLIQEELSQLRYSLAQQGVNLTQFSVDVQQDNGQRNRDDGQQSGRQRILAADDEQDEEASFRVDLNQGLLYWMALFLK